MKQVPSNKLKKWKDFSVLIGAISIALAFLVKESANVSNIVILLFFAIGIIMGIFWWGLNEIIRRYENAIEDLKQYLSQKSRYVEIFSEIFPEWRNQKWTYKELEEAVCEWAELGDDKDKSNNEGKISRLNLGIDIFLSPTKNWKRIARIVDYEDFTYLLVLKARELKIIDEELIGEEYQEYYKLNLKNKSD
jgi:hypothetical protein